MQLFNLPGIKPFCQHLLTDLFRPAAAAHHARVGIRFQKDLPQAVHVMRVFPGHHHECRRKVCRNPVQRFRKRAAQHPVRAGFPGLRGIFLPVLDHRDLKCQRGTEPDQGQGDMARAADHKLPPS